MINTMTIDGYDAVIQYDPDIKMFRGEFVGLNGGADFVLVGEFIWADPRGAAAALAEVDQAIKQAWTESSGKVTTEQG